MAPRIHSIPGGHPLRGNTHHITREAAMNPHKFNSLPTQQPMKPKGRHDGEYSKYKVIYA